MSNDKHEEYCGDPNCECRTEKIPPQQGKYKTFREIRRYTATESRAMFSALEKASDMLKRGVSRSKVIGLIERSLGRENYPRGKEDA